MKEPYQGFQEENQFITGIPDLFQLLIMKNRKKYLSAFMIYENYIM